MGCSNWVNSSTFVRLVSLTEAFFAVRIFAAMFMPPCVPTPTTSQSIRQLQQSCSPRTQYYSIGSAN